VRTKTLLACGMIGAPLFILVFLAEGATRAGYDPLRHPVSSLALEGRCLLPKPTLAFSVSFAGLVALLQCGEHQRLIFQSLFVVVSPGPIGV
jgi:hypothetical protein